MASTWPPHPLQSGCNSGVCAEDHDAPQPRVIGCPGALARIWTAGRSGWANIATAEPRNPNRGDSVFNARIKATTTRIAVAGAGAAVAVGLWAAPAGASPSSTTEHTSFDPTEDVFTCQGGDLTVASGTVYQVFHTNQDATGIVHFTSTITPRHVTLTDASGNGYT